MRTRARSIASALVGGLGVLCLTSGVHAQSGTSQSQALGRIASLTPGSIQGIVQDERGAPVFGAMVSALGASTAFAWTDRIGHFEMRTLSPGPYLVRAHLAGYVVAHGQIVDVRPSGRSASSIALHRVASSRVLAAGMGAALGSAGSSGGPGASDGGNLGNLPQPGDPGDTVATGTTGSLPNEDHGETAWRLRHARRSILKDATLPDDVLAGRGAPPENGFGPTTFGRVIDSPLHYGTNLFAGTPFSGQFNILTTSSFEAPQQLFSTDAFARSVAYVSLGAPVGQHADWTVRGALTQGDIASWIVAGEYVTRAPARHRYDFGLAYATQRYDGGNPAALHDVTDGSRNAGTVYGFDTFTITPAIALTYGSRYARYDYLENRGLISPRVAVTLTPVDHFRMNALLSSRATAPGAEEFQPPVNGAILLPPQRTFSLLNPGTTLRAERTIHAEIDVERDIAGATLSLRAFRQHVSDQLITMFGVEVPGRPAAELGHYFLGNTGDVQANGWAAGFRTAFANRVHGSIEYSETRAQWQPTGDLAYVILLAPATLSLESQRIHDVTTALETEVPETSTKVTVLYRVSNGFARPYAGSGQTSATGSVLDSRFDVQVRQSLPFMDFSSARWEMLIAVRNFFRDGVTEQSVYDELLVVRPPKRIVGGLTLHF